MIHLPFRPAGASRQRGAAAVELALIMLLVFLPLLLGILEVSRLFYVATTMQEVTRRAAREQVVRWVSQSATVQRNAVFQNGSSGTVKLPGGHEVSNTSVKLSFYNTYDDALNEDDPINGVASAQDNLNNCLLGNASCIQYVRASLQGDGGPLTYAPMTGWFGSLFEVPLPGATVIMPAEAMGLP